MSKLEELKKSPEKELTDDELGQVSGGKRDDVENSDITAGASFFIWSNETTTCYWYISSVNNGTVHFAEIKINISNVSQKEYYAYNKSISEVVEDLNSKGATKKCFPSGFIVPPDLL